MFGIDTSEFLIIALVALVVIGPKDLPRVMRTIGQWVGRARGMANHFRAGVDNMIRESELADMEKKWKAENERIMREFPHAQLEGKGVEGKPAEDKPGGGEWAQPVAAEPFAEPALPPKKVSTRPKAPPAHGGTARRSAAPPIPTQRATPPPPKPTDDPAS
ncbi:MAG: twin-arginine translocase subunit TatB [Sphingomonadaceae bacterium]|nr:twin-arginine translocase subunit TatB [Sphingomonadaceae bacterium]